MVDDELRGMMDGSRFDRAKQETTRRLKTAKQNIDSFNNDILQKQYRSQASLDTLALRYIDNQLVLLRYQREDALQDDDNRRVDELQKGIMGMTVIVLAYASSNFRPLADHMQTQAATYRAEADQTEERQKASRLENLAEKYGEISDRLRRLPPRGKK